MFDTFCPSFPPPFNGNFPSLWQSHINYDSCMHNIPACLMRAAKFTFARCFCIRYYEAEYSVYPIVHRWPRLVNAGPSIIASSFAFIESCANFQNGVKQPRATSFISSRNLHRYRPLIASSCAAPLHRIKFAISRDLLIRFLPCPLSLLSLSSSLSILGWKTFKENGSRRVKFDSEQTLERGSRAI